MPTPSYFNLIPEFPSDINIAAIPTISFSKLKEQVDSESNALFSACREYGFFLLDLRDGAEGEILLEDAGKMFDIASETLGLEHDVLKEYAYQPPKSILGYKAPGLLKTDDGKLDAIAMYSLGQDDVLGTSAPRANSEPIGTHRKDFQSFFRHAHEALNVIFSHLDEQLGLERGTLSALNSLEKESDTSLRMLQSSNQEEDRIALGGHTDIGTITMLFNIIGGLQILPSGAENIYDNWQYIKPQAGCALINIGDTMVEWTREVLRSSLHRVVMAPGKQAGVTRRSLAHLVRSERNASMRRLRSMKTKGVIPLLGAGEYEEERSVGEWSAWRAGQVMRGELKPNTTGGRPIGNLTGVVRR
ncbi:hypothetical protein NHQ30_007399 [Ciborinia camelliae]|nr:hypothetical protein NHQ30_007399 [Ciborinia camelliae]